MKTKEVDLMTGLGTTIGNILARTEIRSQPTGRVRSRVNVKKQRRHAALLPGSDARVLKRIAFHLHSGIHTLTPYERAVVNRHAPQMAKAFHA